MLKLLIGPTLVGAGYALGSYYGSDAEQVVHEPPNATYAAFEQALDNVRQSGTTSFAGGAPVPYEIKIDRMLDKKLLVSLFFDGKLGAEDEIDFRPQDGGSSTLVTARIHADRTVLRPVLAGTSKARLAYAPDWMLNLSFRPVLKQLAAQIEHGSSPEIEGLNNADGEAQWEANLSNEQRQEVTEWHQYEATRPAIDPEADAQNYTSGNSQ